MANVETRRDENTFLGSGCNIYATYEHIFYERRLDYKSTLSRSGRAVAHDEERTGHSNGWAKGLPRGPNLDTWSALGGCRVRDGSGMERLSVVGQGVGSGRLGVGVG